MQVNMKLKRKEELALLIKSGMDKLTLEMSQERRTKLKKHIAMLKRRQQGFASEVTGVTDHAIVRYMKRVMGVDIDALKMEIMSVDKIPKHVIDGEYLLHKNNTRYRIVVRDNAVVTIKN